MGYRSDVRIAVSKKGYEQFRKDVDSKLEATYKGNYNFLDDADVFINNNDIVYFGWNSVKWYPGYEDVDIIEDGLRKLADDDFSYRFLRLGENIDDVEEKYYDGEQDKVNVPYPSLSRYVDDEYMIQELDDLEKVKLNGYEYETVDEKQSSLKEELTNLMNNSSKTKDYEDREI